MTYGEQPLHSQLVLRHFCVDGKILYANLAKKTLEKRSTKSVFAKRGFYPDWLERELCEKIEAQFAAVLNRRIIGARRTIELNAADMLAI